MGKKGIKAQKKRKYASQPRGGVLLSHRPQDISAQNLSMKLVKSKRKFARHHEPPPEAQQYSAALPMLAPVGRSHLAAMPPKESRWQPSFHDSSFYEGGPPPIRSTQPVLAQNGFDSQLSRIEKVKK